MVLLHFSKGPWYVNLIMQTVNAAIQHTVHYLEKALYSAGHIYTYGESWHHPVTRQKYISRFIYIIHKCHMVKRQWWKTSAFGVAAGHKDLHSHVESATFTNRIIRFPRGTGTIIVYCLPHLFPLNAGISLLLFHLRGKKRKHGTRKGHIQDSAAASSWLAANRTRRSKAATFWISSNHQTIEDYAP